MGEAGHNVLEELQTLVLSSPQRMALPVTVPPGRARLVTNPAPTGSIAVVMTIGMVCVACLTASAAGVVIAMMQSTSSWIISVANAAKALRAAFREPALEDEVLPFAIPTLPQPVQERRPQVGGWENRRQVADPVDFARRLCSAARGAARRLRASIMMHPTALHHIIISSLASCRPLPPWKPNAAPQPHPEAEAERKLEGVGCRRLLAGKVLCRGSTRLRRSRVVFQWRPVPPQ